MGVWKSLLVVFACKLLFPGEAEVYHWNDNNNWGSQEAEDVVKMMWTCDVQKVLGRVDYAFHMLIKKMNVIPVLSWNRTTWLIPRDTSAFDFLTLKFWFLKIQQIYFLVLYEPY